MEGHRSTPTCTVREKTTGYKFIYPSKSIIYCYFGLICIMTLSLLPFLTKHGPPSFVFLIKSISLLHMGCLNNSVIFLIYPAALALYGLDTCFVTLAFSRKCYFVLFLCLYWNGSYFYLVFLFLFVFSTLICKHFIEYFI